MKKSLEISLAALFLLAFELFIYSLTQMHLALGSGTAASFMVYSFQWLMALTVSIGIAFPAGEFVEKRTGQGSLGMVSLIGMILVLMSVFTAVSFLRASHHPSTSVEPAKGKGPQPAGKGAQDLSETVEFVEAGVKEVSPTTLEMEFKFKNKSSQDITELDYVFVAVEESRVFYKIKIREGVYFPAQGMGTTQLSWDRTRLKSPELFDTLKKAHASKTLKVFAKATRVTLMNGAVIGE